MLIAKIKQFRLTDPETGSYSGFAYCNLVKTEKKLYLNIYCQPKFKSKGHWINLDPLNVHIPIPAMAMMINFISQTFGIKYHSTKERKWRFWFDPKYRKKIEKSGVE